MSVYDGTKPATSQDILEALASMRENLDAGRTGDPSFYTSTSLFRTLINGASQYNVGIGGVPLTVNNPLQVFRTLSAAQIIEMRNQHASGGAIVQAAAGDGTTSGRVAHFDSFSLETTPQLWQAGMNGTKEYIIKDATAPLNALVLANATGNATFAGTIKERARSVAMGEWTTPAFNAADFTAQGAMTWTVDAGDVITYAYMLIGKTMFVIFRILTTTVGGTLNTNLNIKVPGVFTIAKTTNFQQLNYADAGGAFTGGLINANSGTTILALYKMSLGNWSAATNSTSVEGAVFFEVQ